MGLTAVWQKTFSKGSPAAEIEVILDLVARSEGHLGKSGKGEALMVSADGKNKTLTVKLVNYHR